MEIFKEASAVGTDAPDAAELEKINRYSKTPLTAEQVYRFQVRLCDDQPDRDLERFDRASLPRLAELFRGKTGILDHEWSAKGQVARIYDTEVREEGHEAWILASCYMLRTEKNADLIADIEGGIRREVSVGCAMGKATCSICGQPYGVCEHHKGERYGGQQCLAVLSEPTDAYEFSFVAVPAQRQAGVTKGRKGGVSMTLKELVTSTGTPEQQDSLRELEQAAQFGRVCRKELLDEVVRLGLVVDLGADEATLRKACAALELPELKAWRGALEQKAAALFPPQAQLPAAKGGADKLDAAYMI